MVLAALVETHLFLATETGFAGEQVRCKLQKQFFSFFLVNRGEARYVVACALTCSAQLPAELADWLPGDAAQISGSIASSAAKAARDTFQLLGWNRNRLTIDLNTDAAGLVLQNCNTHDAAAAV